MITVDSLSKTFISKKSPPGWLGWTRPKTEQRFEAVKDLTFHVQDSEFLALLGPNGAGKTTALKLLTGILYPTTGFIDIFGFQPFQKTTDFKKTISFVMSQKSQLFLELPIKDTFDFIAEIYNVDPARYHQLLADLTDRFDLADKLDTIGRRLSLGQRMKAELICAFLYQPKVVLLDEPTIGLDVTSAQAVRRFLAEVNHTLGTTIILTTHNMQDVEELCPRTIVINHGAKVFDGPTDELKKMFGDTRDIEFIFEPDHLTDEKGDRLEQQLRDFHADVLERAPHILRVRVNRSHSADIINLVLLQTKVTEINFNEQNLTDVIGKLYEV